MVLVGLMTTLVRTLTRSIVEKSDGFTDVGLYRISESFRAYAYLSSKFSGLCEIYYNKKYE